VSAQTRSGIERHEPERLRGGGADHFPDVDAHAVEDHLELVDQRDVHRAKDVLQELGRLRHAGVGNRDDLLQASGVQRACRLRRFRIHTADELGSRPRIEVLAPRVLALGGEGEEEIGWAFVPARLEERQYLAVRRPRIGGGLEDDQLPGPQALSNGPRRLMDIRIVRLPVRSERGRDADEDRVAVPEPIEVRSGCVPGAGDGGGHARRADVLDERFAA